METYLLKDKYGRLYLGIQSWGFIGLAKGIHLSLYATGLSSVVTNEVAKWSELTLSPNVYLCARMSLCEMNVISVVIVGVVVVDV